MFLASLNVAEKGQSLPKGAPFGWLVRPDKDTHSGFPKAIINYDQKSFIR